MTTYTSSAVETFINEKLIPAGYDVRQFAGSLADSYICIAPAGKWHFIFQEVYLNEWSSGVKMRRFRQLPKWAERKLEEWDADPEAATL